MRLEVQKTYKLYIDGKFPRSESGRYYRLQSADNTFVAGICRSSRKDFRDAVVAARKAQEAWAKKTAFNRSQILYRIAETLQGRSAQFSESLQKQGVSAKTATAEVAVAVDRLVHYAGWADKYQQLFSSVNPVESSHFNFSFPEPTGVISAIAPETSGLAGLVSVICPLITGGNAVIILADEKYPLSAIELAEVMHASDLPGGVVNILTGYRKELTGPFSTHMDVNGVVYAAGDDEEWKQVQTHAAINVKRVMRYPDNGWTTAGSQSPYRILDFQEIKTTWHPVGI